MAREVTPELFHELTGMPVTTVWEYINGRGPVIWDERDIRRLTRKQVFLTLAAPNASGQGARPRTVPNPDWRSVHKPRGAGPVEIVSLQGPAIPGMAQPAPEDIDGDAPFGMVGTVGMAQGLEIAPGQG